MEKSQLRIQDLLSFGYLYLLVLGIIRDSFYYGLLDVNIILYSSVTDILFSPLAYLVEEPWLTAIFVIAVYWAFNQARFHKKHKEKRWYRRWFDVEKREERFAKPTLIQPELVFVALLITSMLLGTGLGRGIGMTNKMKKQKFKYHDNLEFVDGEKQEVTVIGQNSLYIFYVMEDQAQVSISPINGVIKRIELNRK